MELEPTDEKENIKICLVGENRSKTARQKGWTWERCQVERNPRLCANQLFRALETCNIDPYDKENIRFLNLWDDDGVLDAETVASLLAIQGTNYTIVGMGNRVQRTLERLEIEHVQIIHPAARGKIRREGMHSEHVRERFLEATILDF